MGYKCCVPGCRGNYNSGGPKVRLYSFPKDETMIALWLEKISRTDFKPSKHTRVCELHFTERDVISVEIFTDKFLKTHIFPLYYTRLLKDAFPSIMPTSPEYLAKLAKIKTFRPKKNHRTLPYVDCSDPSIERNDEVFEEVLSDPLVDTKSNVTLIDEDQQDIKPDIKQEHDLIKQEIKQEHDVFNNLCKMEIDDTSPDVEIVKKERCDINQFTNETHQPITLTGIYYTEAVINLENDSSPNVNSNSSNKDTANISQKNVSPDVEIVQERCDINQQPTNETHQPITLTGIYYSEAAFNLKKDVNSNSSNKGASNISKKKNNSSIPCDELNHTTDEESGSLYVINKDVAFRISGNMIFPKSVCPEEQSVIFHNYCGPRIDDFCRLCSNDRRGVDMYVDIFNTKRDIQTMISTCLQVEVTMDDDLPKQICKKCYYSLEKAYLFREKTKRAEKNLLRLFRLQDNASESVESSNNIISEEFNSIMNIDNNPILNLKENDDKLLINLEVHRKDDGFYCPFCPRCVKSKQALGTHIELIHLDVNEREKVIKHFRESEDTNLSVRKIDKPNKPESPSNTRQILIEKDSEDVTSKFNQTEPKCSNFDSINNSDECLLSSGDTNNCDQNISNKDSSCTEHLSSCEIEGIQEENLNQVVEESQIASRLASQRQIRIQGEIHGYGCKAKFCHKRFKTMVMKSLHEESEHGKDINVYSCTICKQVFSNVFLILDHLSRVHQEVVKEDKLLPSSVRYLFSCDFCCVLYATYAELIKHRSSCSGLNKFLFTCYCSKQFSNHIYLILHIRTHNSIADNDDPALQRPTCKVFYGCHLCQMMFTSTQGSIQHTRIKHPLILAKAGKYILPRFKRKSMENGGKNHLETEKSV